MNIEPAINQTLQSMPRKRSFNLKIDTDRLKSILKKATITFGIVLGVIILLLITLYFTKFDRKIFPIVISGNVKDSVSQAGLADVQISINQLSTKSDIEGNFSVSGIFEEDNITVKAIIDGYTEVNQTIALQRNFMVFNFTADLQLSPLETGILKGSLKTSQIIDPLTDKLYVNLDEVKIGADGSFTATNLPKGSAVFEFKSIRFKDIDKILEIKEGINLLEEIELVTSGDILGKFTDWLNEVTPIKATIQGGNISDAQIIVKEDGSFQVKDLEIGQEYSLRISHSDYLARDYTVKIVQGENQIFGLRMIANDIIPAYIKRSESNGNQIFKADLDGVNETQVTNIQRLDPTGLHYDNSFLFFRDDYERIKGLGSGSISMGYSVDLNSKAVQRLTGSTNQLQTIYYFYSAGKIINILTTRNGSVNDVKMEIRDIDGSNPIQIVSGKNLNFTNLLVSSTNSSVVYTTRKADSRIDDVYIWEKDKQTNDFLISEEEINFYDVSPNAEIILFTRKNSSTQFEDLVSLDVKSLSIKTLIQEHDGSFYKFDQDSADIFYFVATRDGRNNLYKYDLKTNTTNRVTFIDPEDEISDFYIVDRYLFYIIEDRLYVLDKNTPVNNKLVVKEIETD